MKNTKVLRNRKKISMLKQQFLQSDTGLFDQALGEHEIEAVMRELVEPHRERIYPPLDTLRLFVVQVLSADRACQDVVGRRLSERVAQGQSLSALNTSAYCEARQRMPTTLPVALSTMIGERLEAMTPAAWRWQGRSKPKAMSAEEYAGYPEFITMRELKVNGRILVTTLLDPAFASVQSLGALYAMRWNIEVDFRTIKATLEMDVLRCKSQPMVDKEIAVYFLAYNLVRWAMAKAALLADVLPRMLSFAGRSQAIAWNIRRPASQNIGRSSPHFDCHSDGLYGDIAIAVSARPN